MTEDNCQCGCECNCKKQEVKTWEILSGGEIDTTVNITEQPLKETG